MKRLVCLFLAGAATAFASSTASAAQTTAFTYQGFLTDNGGPANGAYDLTFNVFAADSAGSPLTVSNVVNDLSGNLGQVDTGRVASPNAAYRVEAGFWAIALQQLGYPTLNIAPAGTNAVVSWVTPEPGLILQSTSDLGTPTTWTDTGLTTVTNATTNLVTVPIDPAVKTLFRLRRR
jgi:hypothetical protein